VKRWENENVSFPREKQKWVKKTVKMKISTCCFPIKWKINFLQKKTFFPRLVKFPLKNPSFLLQQKNTKFFPHAAWENRYENSTPVAPILSRRHSSPTKCVYKKVENPSKLFSLVHRLVLWSLKKEKVLTQKKRRIFNKKKKLWKEVNCIKIKEKSF
jgi:hypothetical protein